MEEKNINEPVIVTGDKGNTGAMIGIVVILMILAFGAVYMFNKSSVATEARMEPENTNNAAMVGASSEEEALEEDLNSESDAEFEAELDAMDKEFAR